MLATQRGCGLAQCLAGCGQRRLATQFRRGEGARADAMAAGRQALRRAFDDRPVFELERAVDKT